MLELNSISFAYEGQPVLRDVHGSLDKGLVYGLLGPNGSGKTTLFNLIAGKLTPDEGKILYKGGPLSSSMVGYMEAQPYFYSLINGREYLMLHQRKNTAFNIDKWNTIFKLPLGNLIETYSAGMKKKLAILAMICLDRPVMLLDEPFNNLDLEANQFVTRLFRLLAQKGKIVFLSSHHMEVMTAVADRVMVLNEKQISDTVDRSNFEQWQSTYLQEDIEASVKRARELL